MPDIRFVYGLFDPRTQELQYIGQTRQPLLTRLIWHLRDAAMKPGRRCSSWVRSLLDCTPRLYPEMELLEEVPAEAVGEAERFWIGYFRMVGADLMNMTNGGPGAPGSRPSPETRLKIGAGNRGKWVGPETRKRISAVNLGRRHTAETKAKVSAANRGRTYSPEARARRAEALRRYWAMRREEARVA